MTADEEIDAVHEIISPEVMPLGHRGRVLAVLDQARRFVRLRPLVERLLVLTAPDSNYHAHRAVRAEIAKILAGEQ